MSFSAESKLRSANDCDQDSEQQKPQPPEQEAEVVSDGGEHGVDGIAAGMGEIIAAHAVILFEVPDDGLDGRAPSHVTFDLRGHAALLAGGVDFELVFG